jgi:hypothetical protein
MVSSDNLFGTVKFFVIICFAICLKRLGSVLSVYLFQIK